MFCRGYRQRGTLSYAEVEALPWLIRLRDVASMVLRIGRAMMVGNINRTLERIAALQASVRWLQAYGQRLIDVAAKEST